MNDTTVPIEDLLKIAKSATYKVANRYYSCYFPLSTCNFEDLHSEANLILWEMVTKENIVEGYDELSLKYDIVNKLQRWHRSKFRLVSVPHRVQKGHYLYHKITKVLEASDILRESSYLPYDVLKVEDHSVVPLLEQSVREALVEFKEGLLKLTRKEYEKFIRHICSHPMVESNTEHLEDASFTVCLIRYNLW
jgi:hypothetical protein